MKNEITSIYKYENAEKTTKSYALAKDKKGMHDDHAYTMATGGFALARLRRTDLLTDKKPKQAYDSVPMFSSTIEF